MTHALSTGQVPQNSRDPQKTQVLIRYGTCNTNGKLQVKTMSIGAA